MRPPLCRILPIFTLFLTVAVTPAVAQSFEAAGTRAAGMGGAFVAVADDASAVYWNPAGFAAGSFFSLVLDRLSSQAEPVDALSGGSQSGFQMALGMPALGFSYYRLRGTRVGPTPNDEGQGLTGEPLRLDSLVTHHVGATLVQSVAQGVAVGATLKMVRGIAGSAVRPGVTRGDLLDEGAALLGRASNTFDADIGVMVSTGRIKAGLTIRNLLEPEFEAAGGGKLGLDRQARAGVALMPIEGWLVAADLDLLSAADALGAERRNFAVGTEGRLGRRAFVRAGGRFDTRGESPGGRAATFSVGGSYAVTGSVLVDAQATAGSRWGGRGWGVGARFVY
ncbi:MAG: conjugal transfer protein TraF [Acidobacteria bacterium]|nr:conjugal transfer protein TraF [Acidobacteriota bacterium]MBA3887850.1 conjugal transfer protein TraF [Acidobacteriota bacterium]